MNDLEIMEALDKGTNMFGSLPPEIRARLFAVIDNPTDETWSDAHSIVVSSRGLGGMTLWQALLRYSTYRVMSGPSTEMDGTRLSGWAAIPTRAELITALTEATR